MWDTFYYLRYDSFAAIADFGVRKVRGRIGPVADIRTRPLLGGRGTKQQQVRIAGEGPRLISGTTGNAALSSGFDDDRCIDPGGNHVSDRRVEIDVSFRRTDGDDQAVPGGKVVAFLSGACAPPTL